MRLQKVKAPLKFGIFKERHRYSDYVQQGTAFASLQRMSSDIIK